MEVGTLPWTILLRGEFKSMAMGGHPYSQLLLLYFGVSGGGEDGWRALEW